MTVGDWIAIAGVYPASITFLLVFAVTRSPWWKSPLGWVMFSLAGTSVLTYTVIAATLLLGRDYWGREWIRAVAFTLLAFAYIAKTVAVVHERRKSNNKEETAMSNTNEPVVPAATKLAAKRGFIRTTAQSYAATLSGGIAVNVVLGIVTGEVDLLTVGVTLGVALVSPPVAGLASYLSIIGKGVPEEYAAAAQ